MEFGLIGEKLGHSCSPRIHQLLGVPDYRLTPLPPEELPGFLRAGQFRGLNVTIPYKQAVIPYCRELSPRARRLGSVNTLVRRADGSLWGDNTDYTGFLAMADRAGVALEGQKVLILGSGGTSHTVRGAAEDRGASRVTVVSRKGPVTYDRLKEFADAQVIVNTTPVGMWPRCGERLIRLEDFPSCRGVLDVIYNPLRTPLILDAEEAGILCSGGLPMLVAQAWAAARVFLGREIPEERAWEVLEQLTAERSSLVLLGMPGSGKTTVGRALARALGRPFLDTDREVEAEAGMPIGEIFAREGEAGFRAREAAAIARCCTEPGTVVAIGGGGAMSPENRRAIRQNGIPVLLERRLEALETGNGRPLSPDRTAVEALWRQRMPVYRDFARVTVENNGPVEETVARIRKECGL